MNNFDLNIENYKYEELLNLFKITSINDRKDTKIKIDNYISDIKNNFSGDIYNFFYKSKLIINTIFSLLEKNVIYNDAEIHKYVETIKNIQNLETYSEIDVYNKVISPTSLNTPYYNVNVLDPSLNNKNNTNIIYSTDVNEVAPGYLNSVKRITQLFNLNINSCFRNNYYQNNPCDFLYILPAEIKNVVAMRLVSVEIPNSWYLFSNIKKNNKFQIIINKKNENYVYDIEITEGNYTNETLQEYLNTKYFYESDTENHLKYIKFSINPYSLKSMFEIINDYKELSNDTFTNFSFTLIFSENINQNILNTFGWIIGFRKNKYFDIEEKIISEGLFDAGGDRYIYLCINDFQYNKNTTNMVCFNDNILNEDVIAKIPMINGKLSLVINNNYSPLTQLRRYNGPINLSRLQIKIVDHCGAVIDLNNMDFSITLELQILYESFNFKNVTA